MERMWRGVIVLLITWSTSAASPATDLDVCGRLLSGADYAGAARAASTYLRLHPRSAQGRVLLARAHLGLNDAPAAMADLREALRLEPNNLDALYYCSKLASVLANEEFMTLARIAPDSARMHQVKAEALAAHGDVAAAEAEYRIAIDKRPGTASLMNGIGDLKRIAAEYNEALEWYGKVLARDPENYDALYGAAASHLRNRDPEAALPLFKRALKADPSSLAAKMALGETLLMTGHGSKAVALLEEAAQADPSLKRLQYLLARAYRAAGREQDAHRALKRYRELSGGDSADLSSDEK